MLFNVLMVICIVLCLRMVLRLKQMRRHDRVLYKMCQVRRDIMALFRERGFELSKHDYFAVRSLLDVVSVTIHNFDECKTTVFNIRFLSRWAAEMRRRNKEIDTFAVPKDDEALRIFNAYRKATVSAFFTYTPFIRSEVFLRLLLFTLASCASFIGRLGVTSFARIAENLFWAKEQVAYCHELNHRTA